MKKKLLPAIIYSAMLSLVFPRLAFSAAMTDYCVVPPYVSQNIASNVMLLLDNSHSMLNFAYYDCAQTVTTAADNDGSDNVNPYTFPVKDTTGFDVGDRIAIYTNFGAPDYWEGNPDCNWILEVTAVDSANNTITAKYNISASWLVYDAGAPIVVVQKKDASHKCTYLPACSSNPNYYDSSFDPNQKYSGYFNSGYYYVYSGSGKRFDETVQRDLRIRYKNEWDGNFLNWLTMRRIDLVRKALTGGSTTGSAGQDKLLGSEKADCYQRGFSSVNSVDNANIKVVRNIEKYVPYSWGSYPGYGGTRCVKFYSADDAAPYDCTGGGSGVSSFSISMDSTCGIYNSTEYTVQSRVSPPIEGVLHEVVGTKARIGLSFFKPAAADDGGFVQTAIGGASLSSTVNQINITRPTSDTTPLGEALWTLTGYYSQEGSLEGGPGPRYSSGDYQINQKNDPYNYSTIPGSPDYPQCSKSFVLLFTDGDPCGDGSLPGTILDYASGLSSYNCSGSSCPAVGNFVGQTLPGMPECNSGNVAGVEDVALWSHTNDLRSATLGVNEIDKAQSLSVFVLYAFGKGSTLLKYASINGGFEDSNGNKVPDVVTEWDADENGVPDTFYEATSGHELEQKLRDALQAMLKRASSGTAASVLASGEGSGANLIQAVFYPRRRFGNDIIMWSGSLQNYWYYVDPHFQNSSIREDTDQDRALDLVADDIALMFFNTTDQLTMAHRWDDTDGDGGGDVPLKDIILEKLKFLWEAGKELFDRNLSSSPRNIFTVIGNGVGTPFTKVPFTNSNAATLAPYMDIDITNATTAFKLINYLNGMDEFVDENGDLINDWRSRTVTIGGTASVWKLGDILNSTPKTVSWMALNTYDTKYDDNTYREFYNDVGVTEPANSSKRYKNRGYVFSGGNDGMLHAFKLGKLELSWFGQGPYEKARLTGTDLGKELWAFLPKNALPYLKYIPSVAYCHIYTVDLTPYVFDASIAADLLYDPDGDGTPDQAAGCTGADYHKCIRTKKSWKTILIGGLRGGGASKKAGFSCSDISGNVFPDDPANDCVNTPILDPDDSSKGLGYSSYFALDITDPENPVFLWEFSDETLGYSSTGPAIVRSSYGGDKTKNGRWFVVVGSGPTGPIYSGDAQFLARSDQDLRFFVLDLKTGELLRTIDTGIPHAFAGSLINSNIDPNLDYQDDALYVGYTTKAGSGPYYWTNGGVIRIITNNDVNPANWVWSKFMDNIGSTTASVVNLYNQRSKFLWLFFGTGRYYFDLKGTDYDDDKLSQRRVFGVKDPCSSGGGFITKCTNADTTDDPAALTLGDLSDATSGGVPNPPRGWYINLDTAGYDAGEDANFYAERVITDPLAQGSGLVYFTTFKPLDDECALGGKSYIWAVKYDSGGGGGALLKGKALIQVSTGSIEQLDMATAFKQKGGRRTASMEGVPPMMQGLSIIGTPPPNKRVVHIKEK